MQIMTAVTAFLFIAHTPSTSRFSELEAAKVRWNARGFGDYQFDYQAVCFCVPEVTVLSRVEVQAGRVSRVTQLEGRQPLSADNLGLFSTIEQMFTNLERDLTIPSNDFFVDIEITFDPTFGFPSKIIYVPNRGVDDSGAMLMLTNLQPLK